MNARQRRGVLLMALAGIGALGVFLAVLTYVNGVDAQVGPRETVYRFARDLPRYAPVSDADLVRVQVPSRWLDATAVRSFDTRRGLVTTADVKGGEMLQEGMVGPPPELRPGQRELAILIDAETGVAGKVRTGDVVDIYATFSSQNDVQARVLVSNATVLAIGQLQRVDGTGANQRFSQNEVVPVTFALGVQDSLKLTYAESFATKVRLALVAPGSRSPANPSTDVIRQGQLFASGAK